MESAAKIEAALSQCTGSEQYHYNSIARASGIVYTEGVRTLCLMAAAWWILDAIASHQPRCRTDESLRYMQFWTLSVTDNSGVLICERDEGDIAIRQNIPMTDFPLPSARIWLEAGEAIIDDESRAIMVAMLPSER